MRGLAEREVWKVGRWDVRTLGIHYFECTCRERRADMLDHLLSMI